MMKYYFALPRYNPGKKTADIGAVMVTDYYTLTPIEAPQAYFVQGSKIYGPMGKELIPFKEEAAAREFQTGHQGKAILTFAQITPEVIQGLD